MRTVLIQGPVHCGVFRDLVFHLQADELAEADRLRLQEHLDACPPCARYLEVEQAFIQTLQARLPRHAPPAGLEERVRCALTEHGCEAAFPETGRRRMWIWGVAASILLVALVPIVRGWGSPATAEGPRHVTLEATVVDEDCDRAGIGLAEQRDCTVAAHLNALKLADGTYWSLSVEDPRARGMVADTSLRGRHVVVEGDLYPGIRTLHLTRTPSWGSTRRGFAPGPEPLLASFP